MAKKTLKKKVQTKPTASKFVEPVIDSAKDIWLAGLGAFSVAQQEGTKIIEQGNKMFDRFVKEGAKLEKKTRKTAEGTVDDLREDVESRVDKVRKQATDNWDKLENVFESRVSRVLGRLGVPTAEEVRELSKRVQELSNKVSKLSKAPASRKSTVRKTATRKPAVKKVLKPKPEAATPAS